MCIFVLNVKCAVLNHSKDPARPGEGGNELKTNSNPQARQMLVLRRRRKYLIRSQSVLCRSW